MPTKVWLLLVVWRYMGVSFVSVDMASLSPWSPHRKEERRPWQRMFPSPDHHRIVVAGTDPKSGLHACDVCPWRYQHLLHVTWQMPWIICSHWTVHLSLLDENCALITAVMVNTHKDSSLSNCGHSLKFHYEISANDLNLSQWYECQAYAIR